MRRTRHMWRHPAGSRASVPAFVLLLLLALVASGCDVGDGDGTNRTSSRDVVTTSTDRSPRQDDEAPSERTPQQAREAIATGRALEQLATTFAPVSARINFLVAADTLRRDAIETEADEATVRERSGLVRVEVRRMRPLLVTTSSSIRRMPVQQQPVRRVQAVLVAAAAARLRALDRLEAVLDAEGADLSDGEVDELDAEFQLAWGESVRATREATSLVQDIRSRLGLDPAPEEALR